MVKKSKNIDKINWTSKKIKKTREKSGNRRKNDEGDVEKEKKIRGNNLKINKLKTT